MRRVHFSPVDTWQFGTGTPSQAGSATTLARSSLMPPLPSVVAGAVRASLARARGWDGQGRWPPELDEFLGDGPSQLGALHFVGPFLTVDRGRGAELLVALPLAARQVARSGEQGPGAGGAELKLAVVPAGWAVGGSGTSTRSVDCDLGLEVRLPVAPAGADEVVAGAGPYLPLSKARALVEGQTVLRRDLLGMDELWRSEPRTGIERDRDRRVADDGQLFRVEHLRPVERLGDGRRDVGLAVLVGGVPDDWPRLEGLVRLGAEGRLAEVSEARVAEAAGTGQRGLGMAPSAQALDLVAKSGRAVLVALTPLWLSREAWTGQEPVPGLGSARVVCGVTDRPERAGGWDSLRREPVAQRSVLAPGTTVYVEHERGGDLSAALAELAARTGVVQVGEGREMGFGAVLVGPWPGSAPQPEGNEEGAS